MKTTIKLLLLAVFGLMLFAESASAIPAFARKYRMSCSTCHYPFPRLKAYGDDFAGNGFVLEDQESPRYYVDTGDEELSLVRDLPFAIRLDTWAFYHEDQERFDFKTPWTMKLLSGGAISDHVSYYFYFYFDEHGEVAGIDDAFIMFNDIFNAGDLDMYVGQFSMSDPMMKTELRLTFENYEAYRATTGYSHIRPYYDRGVMATYGMPWGSTGLTAMVVNGNGIGEFEDGIGDNDDSKVFAGHFSQDIGEILNLGVFGLSGSETIEQDVGGVLTIMDNDVSIFGANGSFEMGPLQVNAQYLMRTDSNPYLYLNEEEVTMNGLIAEAIFWPNGDDSKFYGALLYNMVEYEADDNAPVPLPGMLEAARYETATVHIGHMARRNIRVAVEGTYDMEAESFKAGLGVVAAW